MSGVRFNDTFVANFQQTPEQGGFILDSGANPRLVSKGSFLLGDDFGGAGYISGSNGNIEISSSNFMLKANGQVTASTMLLTEVSMSSGDMQGTPITDIKTGAVRAKTVIDSDNKFIGDLKAGTATLAGTAVNTIKTRATTAPDSYILYADTKIATDDMDSNSVDNSTITGLRTYTEDGTAKTKIVVAYLARDTDKTLKINCLAHHNASATTSGTIILGYRDVTSSYVSSALPTLDASTTITVGGSTTGATNSSAILSIKNLTAGNVYEVSVRMTGGEASGHTARSVIMQGVVISVLGEE